MKNSFDTTNEYLEFLAGRRKDPPAFSSEDEGIPEVLHLFRSLRSPEPSPEFRAALKEQLMPGQSQPKQRLPRKSEPAPARAPSRFPFVRFAIPALAVVAIAVVAIVTPRSFWNSLGRRPSLQPYIAQEAKAAVVSLEASGEDALGIDPQARFTLKVKEGTVTLVDVREKFSLSPETEVTVTEKSGGMFEIAPKEGLAAGTVYTATFRGVAKADDGSTEPRTYSWAYQVRDTFQVIGTLPRDKATNVGADTGIEVTFSAAGVTAREFEKHLTIVPEIAGRVELHNRTLVFVPAKKLNEKTLYTVTVTKGLKPEKATEGLSNDVRFQFEVGSGSNQPGYPSARITPSNIFESVRPGDPIVFSGETFPQNYDKKTQSSKPYSYEFAVFQYPNLSSFVQALESYQELLEPWAVYANESIVYPTNALKKVGTFKTKMEQGITTLGTGFAEGAYLADSTSNGVHSQIPFLVGDIGAYVLTTKTDTLVWVHNVTSAQPYEGATVSVRGVAESAQTNADGTATFTTPDRIRSREARALFATVKAGDKTSVVVLNASAGYYYDLSYNSLPSVLPSAETFWSYLSTDRSIYQPNDTVRVWGLARYRDRQGAPKSVHLDVIQRNFEGRYSTEILKSVDLTTTATGTFIGAVDLKDVSTAGYPELVLSADGEWITSKSLSVETYKKPPYRITVTPDRYAVVAGDPVTYDIRTTFFDGTPVPNVGLKLEQNYDSKTADVTTDAAGRATLGRTPSTPDDYLNSNLTLVPVESAEGDIRGGAYVNVYRAHFQIDAEGSINGTSATVKGTARNLHPELADPKAEDPFAKVIGEPRPNQEITGRVIAVRTREIEEGATYDFLAKKTVPRLRYETYEEDAGSFTVTTGRDGTFSKTFTVDPKVFYRVELTGEDDAGKTALTTVYLWSRNSYGGFSPSGLALVDAAQIEGAIRPEYAVGDTAKLQLIDGTKPVASADDVRFLFITAQRGLRDYAVQKDATFTHAFAESDVPAIAVRAVMFSRAGYREVVGPNLDFKESTRQLKIAIEPDRETYGTKDTAKIKVRVTGTNGMGRRARVNLRAIDEAVVALPGQQYENPLQTIYAWVSDGVFASYISHEAFSNALGAERGGGGGDDRINFKDNAFYTELETDAAGNGTATFTLPDNLTSWRITAQAATDDLKVGIEDRLISVQRQLFVVPSFADRMLARDQQIMTATAYGAALKTGNAVKFTFSLPDLPGIESVKNGKAFEPVSFTLPKLDPGDYKLRVAVESGGNKDAVVETVHVLASNIVQQTVKAAYLERSETPVLAPKGRTVLRIGDADRNRAYESLWNLLGNPYARLDDTIAARVASDLLDREFGEKAYASPGDPASFLTDKGLALYAVGSESLEYGALAAADPAFATSRGKLVTWFRKTIDDPKTNTEQVAQALYGLAQLREPVLPEIRALLALSDLPDREKLSLALALESLGAKEEARPVARYLLDTYRDQQDQYLRLKLGASDDEKIVSTARFAVLAAGLNLDGQYDVLSFLATHQPKDTTTHLEQAYAYQRLLGHATPGTVSVTYSLNGTSQTKELGRKDALVLSLDATEAKTFSVTAHAGNISVVSSYFEPFDAKNAARDPNLSVGRSYSVNGKETTTFKRGDLVKVELTWSKKGGALGTQFGIVDLLPTGFRVVSNPWLFRAGDNRLYYPYAVDNNRVKFYAGEKSFYYFVRVATAGTAVAEPPMIQSFDAPSNVQYGNETTVTVE